MEQQGTKEQGSKLRLGPAGARAREEVVIGSGTSGEH